MRHDGSISRFSFAALIAFVLSVCARADASPSYGSIAPGRLTWGGDQEGGGPYIYPADDDPSRVVGFEVDLAARLARHLGLEASFFQGPWDRMPELLRTRKCDIVLNGYEWLPARLEAMEASIPYYVYGLQLLSRVDGDVGSWGDLERSGPHGKRKVGVLTGSAAERYVRERLGSKVELASYDGSTDAMREVETQKLDATVQDGPAATFYRPRFPGLKPIGDPVGRGYYVVFAQKGATALVRGVNEALAELIERGELERLYRSYGIWDDAQRELADIARAGRFYGYAASEALPSAPATLRDDPGKSPTGDEPSATSTVHPGPRKRGFDAAFAYLPILVSSAGLTLLLASLSFPLAVVGGLFIALGRLYGPRWLGRVLAAYVEFLRGTPLMLQLYFIFFFLPEAGIAVPAFWTAIAGLAVNYSAYESEIYRAGLLAVPRGQMEAALALGMSRPLALRRIIVPQAMRIVVPPVMNDFIALFKDTSVCSVVTLVELTKRFSVLSQSTQSTAELMLLTAALYLLMSYPLSLLSRRLEVGLDRVPA